MDDEALKANRGQLANDPGAPATESRESKPGANSGASQPAARGDAGVTTEQAWRRTMAQARANLDEMTRQYELLAGAHLATGEYFVDPRTGENLIGGPERLKQLVAGAKHEMELAQQQVDELLERARRERVPPGWLR